jgi:hypothetical protein
MKRLRTLSVALVGLLAMAFSASASDVDWKVLRYVSVEKAEICFYEAKDAFRTEDKHVSVWMKCLGQKDLDNIFGKEDTTGTIFENTAKKTAHDYMPPIAGVETLDAKQTMRITIYEEIANSGGI